MDERIRDVAPRIVKGLGWAAGMRMPVPGDDNGAPVAEGACRGGLRDKQHQAGHGPDQASEPPAHR